MSHYHFYFFITRLSFSCFVFIFLLSSSFDFLLFLFLSFITKCIFSIPQEQEEISCVKKRERDITNEKRGTHYTSKTEIKSRAKGVKSEILIKPGRQDGKLIIYKRTCAYGECTDCGVQKFFSSFKCPLEWDANLEVNIKEYRDMVRNNSDKKQKELVSVTVTAEELMQKIADTAGNVIKH